VTSRRIRLALTLILLAGTLTACSTSASPQPAIGDGGLLSGKPCEAPCFFGILPGSTKLADAQIMLSNAGVCPKPESFDNASQGGTRGFTCGDRITVSVFKDQENVQALGYCPSVTLAMGDIVDGLGPPDAVRVVSSGLPEHQRLTMMVYYDRPFVRILLREEAGSSYRLDEQTPVERVVYLEKTFFEQDRTEGSKWAGFGEYKLGP